MPDKYLPDKYYGSPGYCPVCSHSGLKHSDTMGRVMRISSWDGLNNLCFYHTTGRGFCRCLYYCDAIQEED